MENWLITPDLPKGSVTLCAVTDSPAAEALRNGLQALGIDVVSVPASEKLSNPCASHPDMQLRHLGSDRIIVGSEKLCSILAHYDANAILSKMFPSAPYPKDIPLNCLLLGDKLFGNLRYTDPAVLEFAAANKIKTISVPQGYTRCSVCVADQNSIITADASIKTAAEKEGIEVLHIHPGFITLPGYDYGFIGGCCGHIGKNHIAFCGNLSTHPDGESIRDFLTKKLIRITELPSPDGTLWDIGGIIPLKEKRSSQ